MNKKNFSGIEHPQIEIQNFGVTALTPESWQYKSLKARFWRLYWHDKLGAYIFLNGKKLEMKPHHIYLVSPGTDFRSRCTRKLLQLSINFNIGRLQGKSPYYCLAMPQGSERLIEALLKKTTLSEEYIMQRIFAAALSALCMTQLSSAELCRFNHEDPLLSRFDDLISDFYQVPMHMPDMAAHFGVDQKTLQTRFRKKMKTTPYQYILKRRYEYAASLLKETDLPVKEICQRICINDQFHFSRTFHKRFGCSPSEYRNRGLENDN